MLAQSATFFVAHGRPQTGQDDRKRTTLNQGDEKRTELARLVWRVYPDAPSTPNPDLLSKGSEMAVRAVSVISASVYASRSLDARPAPVLVAALGDLIGAGQQ